METINHEYYVSLEVAELLKEAGFDWELRASYWYDSTIAKDYILTYSVTHDNWNARKEVDIDYISAPTLDIAQRWLREVKDVDIMIHIDYHYGEDYSKAYCGTFCIDDELYTTEHFKTFEEAQEAGIKKVLKLILKKENKL